MTFDHACKEHKKKLRTKLIENKEEGEITILTLSRCYNFTMKTNYEKENYVGANYVNWKKLGADLQLDLAKKVI